MNKSFLFANGQLAMSLRDVLCRVDDFCRPFVLAWTQPQLTSRARQRQRAKQLSVSEIMTILSWFHG